MNATEERLIGQWNLFAKKNDTNDESKKKNAWMYLNEDGHNYILELRDAVTGEVDESDRLVSEEGSSYNIVFKKDSENVGVIIFWSRERAEMFVEFCAMKDDILFAAIA